MKVYQAIATPTGDSVWCSSEAAQKREANQLRSKLELKRVDMELVTHEIPASKTGLIEWLNETFSTVKVE